jgi:hypothetical protein
MWRLFGGTECSAAVLRGVLLACLLLAMPIAVMAQVDFQPGRDTLLIPKDCRFEKDKERCAEDNRAIDLCRKEKDAEAVHNCLRANQSPLACETRKSDNAKQRCERINRIYQPCKGKRGDDLAACIDQRRAQEKRKKK